MSTNSSTFLTRKQFRNRYGERIYAITHNLEKLYKTKTKVEEHTKFLQQCKRLNLIPNGFILNNTTKLRKNQNLLEKTMFKIRNNTMQSKYRQLELVTVEINTQAIILNWYLTTAEPTRQHQDDTKWMNHHDQKFKEKLIKRHESKIRILIKNQKQLEQKHKTNPNRPQTISNTTTTTCNVINLSTTNLTEQHLKVLSKGLKFVPTPQSINTTTTIANCETGLTKTPPIIKKAAISEITAFINKWTKPKRNNMNKEEINSLNEIKSIDNIIIVQADKGGKIVVLEKADYIRSIEEKLYDKNTYERMTKDPTDNLKKDINELATKLLQQKKITQAKKFELTGIDDLPTIRGQPKLHKTNTPMRIVTCSRDTILSPISKFVFNIIKELRSTITSVMGSTFEFVQAISHTPVHNGENFASLDISDLFTNIPVNHAVNITMNRLIESKKLDNLKLNKTDVKKMLLLCLKNNYFQFNNKYYKQNRGLPMGNTLSPLVADLYMDEYTKIHLQEVNQPSKFWRYVDDILIITKMDKQQLNDYVHKLNNIDSTIRFTYEYEDNNSISFLDTKLTKHVSNNQLQVKIRWFRKHTSSDRFLHYQSCHGNSIKTNIVKNMTTRIIQTTQDPIEQQEDINALKKMLINSNYPINGIERLIKEACQVGNITNNKNKKDKETVYSLSLPYVPGIEVLKRRLEKLKIKLYFSYPNKLQTQFNRTMKNPSKSLIYQVQCDCNPPKIYNGETKVGLKKRMNEHFQLINKLDNKSEMVQHIEVNKFQCLFNTDQAIIVEQEKNWRKRKVKESIYSSINESVNKRDVVSEAWDPILYRAKQQIRRRIQLRQRNQSSNNTSQ